MRSRLMIIFLIPTLITSFRVKSTRTRAQPKFQHLIYEEKNRRILHQPLFPTSSAPPPPDSLGLAQQPPADPSNPIKKVAIATSSGILALGMLSALAFCLYKHRVNHIHEPENLGAGNLQRVDQESRRALSTFLSIGVATGNLVNEAYGSGKFLDCYRPSPELQPLPPLPKPQPTPNIINSPPPTSPSDDDKSETSYYTPQRSPGYDQRVS